MTKILVLSDLHVDLFQKDPNFLVNPDSFDIAFVMKDIPAAKAESMMGDDKRYLHLIGERGRLQQVIATSRKHLAS